MKCIIMWRNVINVKKWYTCKGLLIHTANTVNVVFFIIVKRAKHIYTKKCKLAYTLGLCKFWRLFNGCPSQQVIFSSWILCVPSLPTFYIYYFQTGPTNDLGPEHRGLDCPARRNIPMMYYILSRYFDGYYGYKVLLALLIWSQ